jgi:CheY-like chemotaxis protein
MLIVDDSATMRALIRSMVSQLHSDWNFIEASSGEDALAKAGETEVNIAAVDYHMPGMSGLDLVRNLRARFGGIPVFLVTAARNNAVRTDAAALGIELLNKPFNRDNLSDCLNALEVV